MKLFAKEETKCFTCSGDGICPACKGTKIHKGFVQKGKLTFFGAMCTVAFMAIMNMLAFNETTSQLRTITSLSLFGISFTIVLLMFYFLEVKG